MECMANHIYIYIYIDISQKLFSIEFGFEFSCLLDGLGAFLLIFAALEGALKTDCFSVVETQSQKRRTAWT